MTNDAQPWQNRPSVIAVFEHATAATDLSGAGVLSLPLQMDNLILNQVQTCVPRACRLTRVCIHYLYSENLGGASSFTLDFISSQECTANASTVSLEFTSGDAAFTPNCFCGDVNVLLNECDTWTAVIHLDPLGTTFPLFRVIFHFELR